MRRSPWDHADIESGDTDVSPHSNAIMFADRLVLAAYPLRAAYVEQEVARIVAEAFQADRAAALAIVTDHSASASAGVMETARRIDENLERGDYLAANRLIAEGILRPMAAQTLGLEALASGRAAPNVTSTSDLADFETALTTAGEAVHGQLGEQIRRTVRNADAHAGAHQLIDGTVRLSTRDGVEAVTPIGLEMAYWQLRSMLDGLDTALETAVIVEVGLKRPSGYVPRITTVGQSLVVIRWLAADHGLGVISVHHEGTTAIVRVTGATPPEGQLERLAASIERAFNGTISPLEIVHEAAGWTYRYVRDV